MAAERIISQLINQEILVIFEKNDINRLEKFSQRNDQVKIIALDSVISYWLKKKNIDHLSISEIIPSSQEASICRQAIQRNIESLNNTLLNLPGQAEKEYGDFFDCLKFSLQPKLFRFYFYHLYFSHFLEAIKPKKVFLFNQPLLLAEILALLLKSRSIDCQILLASRLARWQTKLDFLLPKLGREKEHYQFILNKFRRFNVPKKRRWQKHNQAVLKAIKPGQQLIIFSPLNYHTEIKEFLGLMVELKKAGRNVLAIINGDLFRQDYRPLIKNQINFLFIDVEPQARVKIDWQNFLPFLSKLGDYLFPAPYFSLEFKKQFFPQLNFPSQFGKFKNHSLYFEGIFGSLRPSLYFCVEEFNFISRLNLLIAQQQQIKNISESIAADQLFCPLFFRENVNNLFLADQLLVAGEEIKKSYQRLRLLDDSAKNIQVVGSLKLAKLFGVKAKLEKNRAAIKKELFQKLDIPDGSRLIIFTSQQYRQSFDFARILSEILVELNQAKQFRNVYLLIKPHPYEFQLLYRLTNPYRRYRNLRIVRDVDIYEAIISSEFLVTGFSFTAVEAIILNRPVLIVNPLHQIKQLDIFNRPPAMVVDNTTELKSKIMMLLSRPADEAMAKEYDFDDYFDSKIDVLEKHSEIIGRIN